MGVPPAWKLRREVWRVVGKLRFAWMRMVKPRPTVRYRGLDVPVRRSGMASEIVEALLRNYYEDPEIRGIQQVVCPGDRILELGSGLGIVTALAARAAGPGGRVLSFEANPELVADTLTFLGAHGIANVELRNAVLVPDDDGARDFHRANSFAVGSLLGGDKRQSRDTISVPALHVGTVMAEFQPDVLVCDIEGGEAELVPAIDAKSLRAVVIELHPDRLSRAQLDEIYASLGRHGLKPTPKSPGGTVVVFSRKDVRPG